MTAYEHVGCGCPACHYIRAVDRVHELQNAGRPVTDADWRNVNMAGHALDRHLSAPIEEQAAS